MNIDWLTVAAQVVNFLILVYLLKRFLYKPVIAAMDRREARIRDRLEKAREREQEAESRAESYESAQAELEAEREQALEDAREQAEALRERLIDEAREAVANRRAKWRESLATEQSRMARDIQTRSAEAVVEIARRAVSDLAGYQLEAAVFERFLEALEQADENTWQTLARAEGPLRLRSSFSLDETQRSQFEQWLDERLDHPPGVDYELDEELLCGLALEGNGQRLSWSMGRFLDALDEQMLQRLESVA